MLEVGMLASYPAILMAQCLPEGGKVHAIEIDPAMVRLARRNINEAGLGDRVEIHPGEALSFIPGLGIDFDLPFLDAVKEDYVKYLKLVEDRLRHGGAVFADNAGVFALSMQDYLDYLRYSGRFKSELLPSVETA